MTSERALSQAVRHKSRKVCIFPDRPPNIAREIYYRTFAAVVVELGAEPREIFDTLSKRIVSKGAVYANSIGLFGAFRVKRACSKNGTRHFFQNPHPADSTREIHNRTFAAVVVGFGADATGDL